MEFLFYNSRNIILYASYIDCHPRRIASVISLVDIVFPTNHRILPHTHTIQNTILIQSQACSNATQVQFTENKKKKKKHRKKKTTQISDTGEFTGINTIIIIVVKGARTHDPALKVVKKLKPSEFWTVTFKNLFYYYYYYNNFPTANQYKILFLLRVCVCIVFYIAVHYYHTHTNNVRTKKKKLNRRPTNRKSYMYTPQLLFFYNYFLIRFYYTASSLIREPHITTKKDTEHRWFGACSCCNEG